MRQRERAAQTVTALLRARYGGNGIDLGTIETALWNEIVAMASA
jgi:hypothetical protein